MAENAEAKAARERAWWAEWRAADFSWDGLAKKAWAGWAVAPDGRVVEAEGAPEGSRPATLQDYWRDEEARLIAGDCKQWTRAHCPLAWDDGTPTPKAGWNDAERAALEALLWAKLGAAAETKFEDGWFNPGPVGVDRRAQLQGCVLFSAPADLQGERTQLSVAFDRACFFEGARFSKANFLGSTSFTNAIFAGFAAFDGATFSADARFTCVIFSGYASFERATFSSDASFTGYTSFDGATFCSDASFKRATFAGAASFHSANFTEYVDFYSATFAGVASFHRAAFAEAASFFSATFDGDARFDSSIFSEGATFVGATFSADASFERATFSGDASFQSATFIKDGKEGVLRARHAVFARPAFFTGVTFPETPTKFSAAFRGARFEDVADFSRSGALFIAALDEAMFEKKLLIDDPDEESADCAYRRVMLPAISAAARAQANERAQRESKRRGEAASKKSQKPKPVPGKERRAWEEESRERLLKELEGGCRVVKVAMGRERDELLEQRYYRFQLIARRRQKSTPWVERAYSWLYGASSDYGAGLWQPFAVLLFLLVVFAAGYWAWAEALRGWPDAALALSLARPIDQDVWDALLFSANNAFRPLSVWSAEFAESSGSAWISDFLNVFGKEDEGGQRLAIRLVATAQSILSVVLFFLFALAVRRRFQIS